MKSAENIKLRTNATIKDALQIIDHGSMHLALVVDDEGKLLGTVSDGDIRRALLNNSGMDETVDKIMSYNPITMTTEDANEAAIKKALNNRVYQLPVIDKDGYVIGIKVIEEMVLPAKRENKVVLMVGGLGTRLRPLTNETPKPMLAVGGRPILETIIRQFADHGFKDIVLCVNYKSDIIQSYFGDGSNFGVSIEYVLEEKRMGTAGALSLIRDKLNAPFFVMNGDLLTNVNFSHLLEYHTNLEAIATMCVREYDFQVPFGVVEINGCEIKSVVEKPVHKFFVSAGIYMCDPSVLVNIPDDEFYDMPSLFDKLISQNQKTVSFPIREYWLDIGRIEEYEKANNEFHGIF